MDGQGGPVDGLQVIGAVGLRGLVDAVVYSNGRRTAPWPTQAQRTETA